MIYNPFLERKLQIYPLVKENILIMTSTQYQLKFYRPIKIWIGLPILIVVVGGIIAAFDFVPRAVFQSSITIGALLLVIFTVLNLYNRVTGDDEAEKAPQETLKKDPSKGIDQDTFQNVLTRYEEIKISTLAQLLEVEEIGLQRWLITLPNEYGFTIKQDVVKIDQDKIGDQIDDLFSKFQMHETSGQGKVE